MGRKHWTPEEEARLVEEFPLDGPVPTGEGPFRISIEMSKLGVEFNRNPGGVLAKWYELSAKGGYRNVKTRGLPVELTDPGVIRSLAREVKELRKSNIKLKRKLDELDTAINEASDILKGDEVCT